MHRQLDREQAKQRLVEAVPDTGSSSVEIFNPKLEAVIGHLGVMKLMDAGAWTGEFGLAASEPWPAEEAVLLP